MRTLPLAVEYRVYQWLLACWPAGGVDAAALAEFAAAVAARAGDDAVRAFVTALFTAEDARFFRQAFVPFADALVERATTLHLAALVLQCTAPGVPLIAADAEFSPSAPPAELTASDHGGRLRLFVLRTLLGLRQRHPALFHGSKYLSEKAVGKLGDCCVAFARESAEHALLVVVPRMFPPPGQAWEKTALEICGITKLHWVNVFTGAESTGPYLPLSDAFVQLPVAVFLARSEP